MDQLPDTKMDAKKWAKMFENGFQIHHKSTENPPNIGSGIRLKICDKK